MPIYTYSTEESQRKGKHNSIFISVGIGFILIICFLSMYLILSKQEEYKLSDSEMIIPLLGLLLFSGFSIYSIVYNVRFKSKVAASLQISIESNCITLYQFGYHPKSVQRFNIELIEEIGNEGLRIYSSDQPDPIFIPMTLIGYDEIRSTLATWFSITSVSASTNAYRIVIPVAIILCCYVLMQLRFAENWEPLRIAILLFPLASWLVYILVSGNCGGNITRNKNPFIYWYVVLTSFSVFAVLLWVYDFTKVFSYQQEVLWSINVIVVVWILFVFHIIRKYWPRQRD